MKAPRTKNILLNFLFKGIGFSLLSFSILKSAAALDQQYLKFDIPSLEQEASQNDVQAQTALGWAYYFGQNVDSDEAKANEWFKKAAKNGSDEAALQLGIGYMSGSAGKVDLAQSRDWLEKAFHAGNADAGMYLGTIYNEGIGVDRDSHKSRHFFEQSVKIYEKDAEKGTVHAINVLSFLYNSGYAVSPNPDKASHFKDSLVTIAKPDNNAQIKAEKNLLDENLTELTPFASTGSRKTVEVARLAALNESFYGYQILGTDYVITQGMRHDPARGLDWFLRASLAGVSTDDYFVANLYDEGYGVPANKKLAEIFYRRTFNQLKALDGESMTPDKNFQLGYMYRFGLSVKADTVTAHKYFTKACEAAFNNQCADLSDSGISKNLWSSLGLSFQENLKQAQTGAPSAIQTIINSYHRSNFTPKRQKQAFKWAQKLSDQGEPWGEYVLAHYYQRGIGTDRNIPKSLEYYEKVAKHGEPEGYLGMADIYMHGDGVPKDKSKADTLYKKFLAENKRLEPEGKGMPRYELAYLYENGYGVDKDIERAVQYYKDGVGYDESKSYLGLARLYMEGKGVAQSYKTARHYAERAYGHYLDSYYDFGEAPAFLGQLYLEGKIVPRDLRKAREQLEYAASFKNPDALYWLGHMYQEGSGVDKDLQKSREYFTQACERANQQACQALKRKS